MPLFIPTSAVPMQTISPILNNQATQLNIYQLDDAGLFMDVYLQSQPNPIIQCRICQNFNCVIGYPYLGFSGDFVFWDSQGATDPNYLGLGPGGRYQLWYYYPFELGT